MSHRRSHSGSRGSPSQENQPERGKSSRRECTACGEPAMLDKRLCKKCLMEASNPPIEQLNNMMDWMQSTFKQSMATMVDEVTGKVMHNLSKQGCIPAASAGTTAGSSRTVQERDSISSEGEISETDTDEAEESAFNIDFIEPLIRHMRITLDLDEDEQIPKQDKMFRSRVKKTQVFPVHDVIASMINAEWEIPDRKMGESKRFNRMFPFSEKDVKSWNAVPKVDAAITRVARRTTLPVDEGVSLKDAMERRQDAILKKLYLAGGKACKTTVATTSLTRANSIWISEVEKAVKEGADQDKILDIIQDIKTANNFASEASLEGARVAARSMGLAVAARRALWLRHWHADSQSKHNLCSLPFKGEFLFGERLDQIISKASVGKSAFLPQDRKDRRNFRNQKPSFRDTKQYKPGKPFVHQPWRSRFRNQDKRDQKPEKKTA
ncbi:lamina-associated polypeptide 2-like isoform X2 [Xenopus laevis]|uniref:Lamina-associated polypeptide 2-like isoform X2 n=1 Tax=Xenopus laevis TaxID=8355 RepID=A0A8J0UG79_XENLA|nr:lamina-associated polypeptide 2-like isoform X2 [Xenopus laevis]